MSIRRKIILAIRLFFGMYCPDYYIIIGRYLSHNFGGVFLRRKFAHIGQIYHLEIHNFQNIGKNLVLGHPSGITVNSGAIIGDNCVIFKNATIGSVRSGKREGVPVIGNNCVIGTGAFVCGGIHIGNMY